MVCRTTGDIRGQWNSYWFMYDSIRYFELSDPEDPFGFGPPQTEKRFGWVESYLGLWQWVAHHPTRYEAVSGWALTAGAAKRMVERARTYPEEFSW